MKLKERYQYIIDYFSENLPEPETELMYETPFQLLIAVVLSAQCTDKRVNIVTPALFKQYPTPESLANADVAEVFEYIRSISYPNNKAKHLVGLGKMLVDEFDSEIPMTVNELIKIPGVGRKTANVITSVLDQQPNMAVDTHVYRVSRRLGLVPQTANTPFKVEQILIKHFPKELIHKAHHWLILHGRYMCLARTPKCDICEIKRACKYYAKQNGIEDDI
jgi:endonuclease-3